MNNLTISLPDGTFEGIVLMHSDSAVSALRIPRRAFSLLKDQLDQIGLYMFLIDNDTVYVGQSGQPLSKRIIKKHRGSIDSDWHTVVAFPCNNRLTDNELKFIENALCEFVHLTCPRCATKTPTKENCNEKYRNKHYLLTLTESSKCNHYIDDIKFYISHLKDSNFSLAGSTVPITNPTTDKEDAQCIVAEPAIINTTSKKKLFSWSLKDKSTYGFAEIELFPATKKARHIILKKGTKLSTSVSVPETFSYSAEVNRLRKQYEFEGKIKDYILLQDIELPPCSSSFSLGFIAGSSHSGNQDWRTVDEPRLALGEIEQRVKRT